MRNARAVTPTTVCAICKGELWVCENHPDMAWNVGDPSCCSGAGMPCRCNPTGQPMPGSTVIWDRDRGYLQ